MKNVLKFKEYQEVVNATFEAADIAKILASDFNAGNETDLNEAFTELELDEDYSDDFLMSLTDLNEAELAEVCENDVELIESVNELNDALLDESLEVIEGLTLEQLRELAEGLDITEEELIELNELSMAGLKAGAASAAIKTGAFAKKTGKGIAKVAGKVAVKAKQAGLWAKEKAAKAATKVKAGLLKAKRNAQKAQIKSGMHGKKTAAANAAKKATTNESLLSYNVITLAKNKIKNESLVAALEVTNEDSIKESINNDIDTINRVNIRVKQNILTALKSIDANILESLSEETKELINTKATQIVGLL